MVSAFSRIARRKARIGSGAGGGVGTGGTNSPCAAISISGAYPSVGDHGDRGHFDEVVGMREAADRDHRGGRRRTGEEFSPHAVNDVEPAHVFDVDIDAADI